MRQNPPGWRTKNGRFAYEKFHLNKSDKLVQTNPTTSHSDVKMIMLRAKSSIFFGIFLVLCITAGRVYGWDSPSGAVFLKIGTGARPAGMGGAFIALCDDINAISWNPAGLVKIEGHEITATHTEWISDIRYDFLAYAQRVKNVGVFGASVLYLYMGRMEERNSKGESLGCHFTASDACASATYARFVQKRIAVGANLKLIREVIAEKSATGVALDLGQTVNLTQNINLGIVIKNIGTPMRFVKTKYYPPLMLVVGLGVRLLESRLIFGLDYEHQVIDYRYRICGGCEYWFHKMFAARAGINYRSERDWSFLYFPNFGVNCGLGFKLGKYELDYAFVPYGELSVTHRISFAAGF